MVETADFIVIGAGVSGASAAANLAPHGRVLLLEAEDQPGYHATGRSAALWTPHYGNQLVRTLIAGSRDFLMDPPDGFSEHKLLEPRGLLTFAAPDHVDAIDRQLGEMGDGHRVQRIEPAIACKMVPILRPEIVAAATYDPDVLAMDVNAIHRGFLRAASRKGVAPHCEVRVISIARRGNVWHVASDAEEFEAPVIVNAAGAWADEIAIMAGVKPIGLQPMRRTAVIVDGPDKVDVQSWPAVDQANIERYFKPEAGKFMLSPGDETPVDPQDAQPEDLDVAIVIDWFETVTTLKVRQVRHRWAGLRSFVSDRAPVVGFDPSVEGFFWLAGQGGYGIMLSPVLGRVTAALIAEGALPADLRDAGLDPAAIAPGRLGESTVYDWSNDA
ncbi:MAG: FAD-binding oxidoreductase [Dongiaceae bacterium]